MSPNIYYKKKKNTSNKYKDSPQLRATDNQTQPLRTTSKMVKSACASMKHFLHRLNSDIRKRIIRLEYFHLKILKRKYSVVLNKTSLDIYKCIYTHTLMHGCHLKSSEPHPEVCETKQFLLFFSIPLFFKYTH